jgi:hypothetical protein
MTTNTGGPAFPALAGRLTPITDQGMTLRDYFAGKAMQSELVGGVHSDNFDVTARRAYHMADAMLKARGTP